MSLIKDFLSLLYPETCPACGKILLIGEKVICTSCFFKLPRTNFHLMDQHPLIDLFAGRIELDQRLAFLSFQKGGMVQKLIHEFKYKNRKEIGFVLGEIYANELKQCEWIDSVDYLIPIPLHEQKLKKRGFNQSEEFASGIAKVLQIPLWSDLLYRVKFSETQTKKTKYKRWENVKDIFEVTKPEIIENSHILLIDDVITTGATMEAAGACLKQVENLKLSVVAMAFTAL